MCLGPCGVVRGAGHGAWGGADAGVVFVVGEVADPVQTVLDAPVPANMASHGVRVGSLVGEVGQTERDGAAVLAAVLAAAVQGGSALDPERVCGGRVSGVGIAGVGGGWREPDGAVFGAAVPGLGGG